MKKAMGLLALALLTAGLCGCSSAAQLENQAYAVSMSVDMNERGETELGVQVPRVSGAGESESGGGGEESSPYLVFTATDDTFSGALHLLRATMPRDLRLSQLKSLVISEKLARDAGFSTLISEAMLSYQMYSAAYVVICSGEAKAFLEAQKPFLGTRLSAALTAELEHYGGMGYTVRAHLADLYFALNAGRSDATAAFAATGNEIDFRDTSPTMDGAMPGALSRSGENKNEYMGCALFVDGKMVAALDGGSTRWLNVLTGSVSEFDYFCGESALYMRVTGTPSVRMEGNALRVSVHMYAEAEGAFPDMRALEEQARGEIEYLVRHCQSLGAEPFGVADAVCARSATWGDYARSEWRTEYAAAEPRVTVTVEKARE